MTNEEKAKQILNLFHESMNSDERHLLIKLYEVCVLNKDAKTEPDNNLLQFETSFNIIELKIINQIFKKILNSNYVDADNYEIKKYFTTDMKPSEKIRKNIIKNILCGNYKNNKVFEDDSIDESRILQYYIMLDDCIKNYDDDNIVLKKKAMKLLTEIEILLKLPITFPSQIPNCVDDLIEENNKEKKGGVTFGR